MRLSEACLQAPDVGALVCLVDLCGDGFSGGCQVGVPKGRPALQELHLCGRGALSRVEECSEWVGCSFLPTESGVEPAAGAPEVVCDLLWCRLRQRFRRWGCCARGWELWVREVEATVVEVKGEEDVAGRHVQAAPAVA